MIFGNPIATNCIYLPHAPSLPNGWHWQSENALALLLGHNSNHWRKILVISAKIFAIDDDWRTYLHTALLNDVCFYADEKQINQQATVGLFSGREIARRLIEDYDEVQAAESKIFEFRYKQWMLPYFDYRQFPNALIEEFRSLLR